MRLDPFTTPGAGAERGTLGEDPAPVRFTVGARYARSGALARPRPRARVIGGGSTDTIIDPATRWRGEAINPYSTDVDRKAGCSSECHRLENIINQIIRVIHGNLIAGICPALIIADRTTSGDAIRTINGKVPEDGTMPQEFWAA